VHLGVNLHGGLRVTPQARVVQAVPPRYPHLMDWPKSTAMVELLIMADGRVGDAWIFKSSGDPREDQAALEAATTSTYAPKIAYCQPTIGNYIFGVTFD